MGSSKQPFQVLHFRFELALFMTLPLTILNLEDYVKFFRTTILPRVQPHNDPQSPAADSLELQPMFSRRSVCIGLVSWLFSQAISKN
jgi:hypothetical protein